jgi:acetyl-CoA carboxylase biotin carboxyl carrier protein
VELKHIKELMAAMVRSGITKVSLKDQEVELVLEREAEKKDLKEVHHHVPVHHPVGHHFSPLSQPLSRYQDEVDDGEEAPAAQKKDARYITSPMVGTIYSSPSPGLPPFIKVGQDVTSDTVVCIVEAMKVMNEVKAGVDGVIAEVMIEDGNPVEFGTPIFRVT